MLSDQGRIFVAGGAGMAGTAIVQALLARRPTGLVRASCRELAPAVHDPRVEHVAVDLSDPAGLRSALAGCDAAVFAAAEGGGVRMLIDEPWRQVGPNLLMASTWLQALHD